MNKIIFSIVMVIGFVSSMSAQAAPRSRWQSAKVINAVLSDKGVQHAISSNGVAEISSIQVNGNIYTITTAECTVDVTVQIIGAPMPGGPSEIERIEVGTANCLPGGATVGNF